MARPNPRLAAGVGLLTAVLILGGSGGAQAYGHPGERGDRGDRGNSSSERGCCRGGSDRDDDRGYGRGDHSDRPGHGGNTGKPGSIGKPGNGRNDDDSATQDSRQIPPLQQGSARVGTQRLAPADEADPGERSDGDDDSGSDRDSGSRGGSDRTGTSAPGFNPPRVTVGNGRSPGIQDRDREPRGGDYSAPDPAPAPQPPPPPPPAPPPPPSIVERIATPPVLSKQLGVAPAANWHGPLWGIAGLLLIPAAGAVLGYRQARAAHAAERLGRS